MNIIQNDKLKISIKDIGAELTSIFNKANNREYLWTGNPKYWSGQSPLLFPFIGNNWNMKYKYEGKEYSIDKHGWARFKQFEVVNKTSDQVTFKLTSNDETKKSYPFDFSLNVSYTLKDWQLKVDWKVSNPSNKSMFFQIGGHPGFNYVDFKEEDKVKGYFQTNCNKVLFKLVGAQGCLNVDKVYTLESPDGIFELRPEMFDNDAYVIQDTPIEWLQLLDKNKKPYVKMDYKFPVTGIWTPAGKNAPFVCIEPWYGCCDRQYYDGDLAHKDYINELKGNQDFDASYTISIVNE